MKAALVRQDDNLDRYMAEVGRHPLLDRDAELALATRLVDDGDVGAAHALVVANLRFVVKVAHEFRGYGLRLLDLVQEGNVGLMVAVKKFDPRRGYRLLTYAVWWIRAHMQSFVLRSWSLVRLGGGRTQRRLFFKLRSALSRATRLGATEAPDAAALADQLGVDAASVTDMAARLAARDFSLDAQVGGDGDSASHLEQLPDAAPSPEDALGDAQAHAHLRGRVARVLGHLGTTERAIVERRLLSDTPATLQELGDAFALSRERIRQLERRVLGKLRASLGADVDAALQSA